MEISNHSVAYFQGKVFGISEIGLFAYENGIDSSINVILIGGLGDTLLSLSFSKELEAICRGKNYKFVILQLRSQPNFRMHSIEDDIEDIHNLLTILSGSFVLIGHSTGCQDVLLYMDKYKNKKVKGIVLQAPVSDIESLDTEDYERKCASLMSIKNSKDFYIEISGKIWLKERFISLFSKNGTEDLFSSYISDEYYKKWNNLGIKILTVLSGNDEFCRKDVSSKLKLMSQVKIIEYADHGLTNESDRYMFANIVSSFLDEIFN